ncbi:hypothetical protein F4778DRAFT_720886 [Xylariomycetidae sp. FL2044]|nr:hypothetical protein F4778DRAFT_720886 [Xylariomycetidae sp. FL2044]
MKEKGGFRYWRLLCVSTFVWAFGMTNKTNAIYLSCSSVKHAYQQFRLREGFRQGRTPQFPCLHYCTFQSHLLGIFGVESCEK